MHAHNLYSYMPGFPKTEMNEKYILPLYAYFEGSIKRQRRTNMAAIFVSMLPEHILQH